jgi:uncharacterized protein
MSSQNENNLASEQTLDNKSRHVQRHPERELAAQNELYAILDEAKVAHVGFVSGDEPVVMPMGFVRDGNSILIHGSTGSRFFLTLKQSPMVCATVTILDDIIVARSAFNCSMNYRSVVAFGRPVEVTGDEKWEALKKISNGLVPGLWERAREMTKKEMAQTMVLRLNLDQASAKQRSGGANDEAEDKLAEAWAGRLPLAKGYLAPVTNEDSKVREVPDWISAIISK